MHNSQVLRGAPDVAQVDAKDAQILVLRREVQLLRAENAFLRSQARRCLFWPALEISLRGAYRAPGITSSIKDEDILILGQYEYVCLRVERVAEHRAPARRIRKAARRRCRC